MDPLDLLAFATLNGLVVFRVWRLIALDVFFDEWRERVLPAPGTFWRAGIDCSWCTIPMMLHAALAVMFVVFGGIPVASGALLWLAGTTVTGVVGRGD